LNLLPLWPLGGMLDTEDLKSSVRKGVPVGIWQGPPLK